MKILLTGATGFIGQRVYNQLIKLDSDVYTIARKNINYLENYTIVDILNKETVLDYINNIKPDILIHLAWDVAHGEFWNSSKNEFYKNSSIHLFHAFLECGGQKIIASGTCAEYEASCLPVREDQVIDNKKLTHYGRAKKEVLEWLESKASDFTWCRIFGIYGPGENTERLFPAMLLAIREGRKFLPQSPDTFFDYMHVDDIADFIIKCINKPGLGIVNMGTGRNMAAFDLYNIIRYYMKSGVVKNTQTIHKPNINSRIPNCTKLKSYGFEYSFEKRMKELVFEYSSEKTMKELVEV